MFYCIFLASTGSFSGNFNKSKMFYHNILIIIWNGLLQDKLYCQYKRKLQILLHLQYITCSWQYSTTLLKSEPIDLSSQISLTNFKHRNLKYLKQISYMTIHCAFGSCLFKVQTSFIINPRLKLIQHKIDNYLKKYNISD